MNTQFLDIRLTEAGITIGPVLLVPCGSQVASLYQLLGVPDRILPMLYKELTINNLYLYDMLGVRFWAKQEVVSELQLVLETTPRETFPTQAFKGGIYYQNCLLPIPISGTVFQQGLLPGFVQNDDRLHYGQVVFEHKTATGKYVVLINSTTGNVEYISIS
jgi:hypothetical protein